MSVLCGSLLLLVGVLRVITCTLRGVFCSGVLHFVEGVLALNPEVDGVTAFTSDGFTLVEGVDGLPLSLLVEGVLGGVDKVVT